MGIKISIKSKSPVAKEAIKIASLISSFIFERGDSVTTTEINRVVEASKIFTAIANKYK